MRVRTILSLGCFVALLFTGAAFCADPAPAMAPAIPLLDTASAAPVCPLAPVGQNRLEIPGGPGTDASCPTTVWQQCYQTYGSCALCFCFGSTCECENRCQ